MLNPEELKEFKKLREQLDRIEKRLEIITDLLKGLSYIEKVIRTIDGTVSYLRTKIK